MIEIRNLTKTFSISAEDGAPASFDALKNVSLTVGDGDIFGIIGMSGAGKSTLVRCINMLERPTEGQVLIDGVDIGTLTPARLRAVRREITMIFQGFNLLMQRTCLANVTFPLELSGMKRSEARKKARELLEIVGLPDKAKSYPAQLSGGQQQRVAIARALATNPKVLLCDEATSALDPNTTHAILELIRKINRELGITVIIITHQMSVVEEVCSHVAILDAGQVVEMGEVSSVFSNPQSDAARRLVYPDANGSGSGENERSAGIAAAARAGERVLRVVFNGSHTTDKPFITQMAIDTGIAANILYASTRCLGECVFGDMLLGIPDTPQALDTVRSYFAKDGDIIIEEIGEVDDRA
ncbi:MAG: ATP-binding cassette domain-containing protein [Clostridia bacterium]|nr:ATP-binding cassette domain-containing protein [Clostridia bacterium]